MGDNYSENVKDSLTKIEYLCALHGDLRYAVRMGDQEGKMTFDQVAERAAWLEACYQQAHHNGDLRTHEFESSEADKSDDWKTRSTACKSNKVDLSRACTADTGNPRGNMLDSTVKGRTEGFANDDADGGR